MVVEHTQQYQKDFDDDNTAVNVLGFSIMKHIPRLETIETSLPTVTVLDSASDTYPATDLLRFPMLYPTRKSHNIHDS